MELWPPMSHILIETLFLVTFRMLKPTVGIMSSTKSPPDTTFTNDVFPAFCNPTRFPDVITERERERDWWWVTKKIPQVDPTSSRERHHHSPERQWGRDRSFVPETETRRRRRAETERKKERKKERARRLSDDIFSHEKTPLERERERDTHIFPSSSSSPIPISHRIKGRQYTSE